MAGAATVTAPALARALDLITRVRGVRGAMVVSRTDGLVVAEQLMEGIKGSAVAALASSLAGRLQRAMVSAGLGSSQFWHLQCDQGALLVVPAGAEHGLLLVAVTEADVNVGLVRLELLRAAETAA
jgi:predicted regulator of Ras-like GTPase activity (Roadblock/LC7/MglB family)